jgi:NAD(P)-dependent dehydrogenase (short-subunit alcohol dehydrogenase family)
MQEVDSLLPEGLDYLVCNAGITGDRVNASDETPQTVRSVFDTNIFGTLTTITEAMPLLRRGHKKMVSLISACLLCSLPC